MSKSRDAFRTISEVAEWLDTPAHVLRFWESKFTQVKPVKRAGGRRYYRPADMELLGGIKTLLHDEGMTIKGVQKVLREQGVRHVASLASEAVDTDQPEDMSSEIAEAPFAGDVEEARDSVVPFAPLRPADAQSASGAARKARSTPTPEMPDPAQASQSVDADPEPATVSEGIDTRDSRQVGFEEPAETAPVETFAADDSDSPLPDFLQSPLGPEMQASDAPEQSVPKPDIAAEPQDDLPQDRTEAQQTVAGQSEETEAAPSSDLQDPVSASAPNVPAADTVAGPSSEDTQSVDTGFGSGIATPALPDDPDLDAIEVTPGCLSHLSRIVRLSQPQMQDIAPLAARLRAHLQDLRQG